QRAIERCAGGRGPRDCTPAKRLRVPRGAKRGGRGPRDCTPAKRLRVPRGAKRGGCGGPYRGPPHQLDAGFGLLSRSCQLGLGKIGLKSTLAATSHGQSVCFSPSQPTCVTTPVASTF